MKKTVLLILLVSPLILIYIISFAGRILADYKYIYVERIVFLDDLGDEYNTGDTLIIGKDKTHQLNVKVYPELATNKNYRFIYNTNDNIINVSSDGWITTLEYGTVILIAETHEKSITTSLTIIVMDTEITNIALSEDNIELGIGAKFALTATITPHTASPRNITWSSSDPLIAEVDKEGIVTAISTGTAIVTATTPNGITADVVVTVITEQTPGIYFINKDHPNVLQSTTNKLNLYEITHINLDNINYSNLKYSILSGNTSNNDIKLEMQAHQLYVNFNDIKFNIITVKVEVINTPYFDVINIVYV